MILRFISDAKILLLSHNANTQKGVYLISQLKAVADGELGIAVSGVTVFIKRHQAQGVAELNKDSFIEIVGCAKSEAEIKASVAHVVLFFPMAAAIVPLIGTLVIDFKAKLWAQVNAQ